MAKKNTLTAALLRCAARRLPLRESKNARRQGFILTRIAGRICGGSYAIYSNAVTLASGTAETRARRIDGLPGRFEALFLMCRLIRSDASGLACREVGRWSHANGVATERA